MGTDLGLESRTQLLKDFCYQVVVLQLLVSLHGTNNASLNEDVLKELNDT